MTQSENRLETLALIAREASTTIDLYAVETLKDITISHEKNARQWTYQYCTEFAWFQVPNSQVPMRSWRIHEDFWMDYCRRIFGPLDEVDVSKNEKQYKGVNI